MMCFGVAMIVHDAFWAHDLSRYTHTHMQARLPTSINSTAMTTTTSSL